LTAFHFEAALQRLGCFSSPLPLPGVSTFNDEAEAHAFVRAFVQSRGWAFAEQFDTGFGRIDFALLSNNTPWLGIEVKPDINSRTGASQLADYLEQAMGYSADLGVPVLLGPAMSEISGVDGIHYGGTRPTALSGLTIYGGRVNVGLLAFDEQRPASEAAMCLRGRLFYRFHERYGETWSTDVERVLRMVRSRNSRKVRE
jgi:hypothetical protein